MSFRRPWISCSLCWNIFGISLPEVFWTNGFFFYAEMKQKSWNIFFCARLIFFWVVGTLSKNYNKNDAKKIRYVFYFVSFVLECTFVFEFESKRREMTFDFEKQNSRIRLVWQFLRTFNTNKHTSRPFPFCSLSPLLITPRYTVNKSKKKKNCPSGFSVGRLRYRGPVTPGPLVSAIVVVTEKNLSWRISCVICTIS